MVVSTLRHDHDVAPIALKMDEPQRRETCWRVVEGPTGRLVVCAIYETPGSALELRLGYAPDRPLRSERLGDLNSARVRAGRWLDAFRAAGLLDLVPSSIPN